MIKPDSKIKRGLVGLILIGLMAMFAACNSESPLSSTKDNQSVRNNVEIVDLGEDFSLSKSFFESKSVVTPEDGGQLVLTNGKAFEGEDDFNLLEIVDSDSLSVIGFGERSGIIVRLKVLPYSVKDTTTLSVEMHRTKLDLTYGPHGTVFANAAQLSIFAVNLNLKDVNEETLGIYYENPDNGQWEKMETESVVVDEKLGFLHIRNALIPHFSRYAVAWSR